MFALHVVALLVGAAAASLTVHTFGPEDALLSVVIVCGMHPREGITRDVCEDWVRTLQDAPPTRMHVTLVPDANPEGREMLAQDECWRGNARGVDLNRNWPPLACDSPPAQDGNQLLETELSHGPYALSEWETQELAAVLTMWQPDVLLAIHSGIEAFLTPFDACAKTPRNYHDHVKLAKWLRHGVCDQCTVAQSPRLLYYSQGTMTDWAYAELRVPLVLTVEMYAGDETGSCAQVFSPPANTMAYNAIVLRWRKMIQRLATIDADDFLTLLEMTGVAGSE